MAATKLLFSFLLVAIFSFSSHPPGVTAVSPWAWDCNEAKKSCSRVRASETTRPLDLMECKMTCSDQGLVWPLPTGSLSLSKELEVFADEYSIALVAFNSTPTVEFLAKKFFTDVFVNYLTVMRGELGKQQQQLRQLDLVTVNIDIQVEKDFADLTMDTDESYSLSSSRIGSRVQVEISAKTYQGMRHGLETLSQLISWNEVSGAFQIHSTADIADAPAYAYRGVSLDTSRNFIPVPVLKRFIDGLSYNKLNVFHWHITDSQSFPLCLPSVPQLCEYGSYSEKMRFVIKY